VFTQQLPSSAGLLASCTPASPSCIPPKCIPCFIMYDWFAITKPDQDAAPMFSTSLSVRGPATRRSVSPNIYRGRNLGIRPTPHASAPSFVDSWAPFRAVEINVARIECADPGSTAWKLTIGRVRNRLPNQQHRRCRRGNAATGRAGTSKCRGLSMPSILKTQKDRYLIQDPPRPWRLNGNQARCYHHVSVQTEPDRGRRNRWHSMHAVSRNTRRPAIRLGLRS
jgi:hypothetical protein